MLKCTIDPDHSVAAFAVRHMTIANVRGQFNKISGTVYFDETNPSNSSVEAEIDVTGITTGIRKRDEHLLSPDFFDAAKYPSIIFKSTKVEITGDDRGKVTGDLTVRGVTLPVTLDVEYFGPVKSPFGGEVSFGFSAVTRVNRFDFGINWNEIMEKGGLMVGSDVLINIDIEADIVND